MASKNIYIPSTQGYATFATTHTTVDDQNHGSHSGAKTMITKVRELVASNTGLLLVTASQAFFALMNVAVKKLNSLDPPVPPLELIFVRMAITYICCMAYMLSTGVPEPFLGPKGVRLLLVLRGFSGFFGLFGIYYSLQYLSLSDATVLTFLAPLCTAVAGALLLGEQFTRRQALAGVFSLAGVVLIARPAAIFGVNSNLWAPGASPGLESNEKGTPAQRLVAVCDGRCTGRNWRIYQHPGYWQTSSPYARYDLLFHTMCRCLVGGNARHKNSYCHSDTPGLGRPLCGDRLFRIFCADSVNNGSPA